MKRKKGTCYCLCFLLVSITTNKIRCPIYTKLVTKKEYNDKVGLLAQIWFKLPHNFAIRRVYLDRGFCTDTIIEFLEARRLEYVIAAKRVQTVKKAITEIRTCVDQLAGLSGINLEDKLTVGQWCRKRGLDTFKVKHIMLKKRGTPTTLVAVFTRVKRQNCDSTQRQHYMMFLYVTNCRVSDRYIVRLYAKRWIIETDIRCIRTFRAITNSTSPQLRFLIFGLAVLLDVLWVIYSTFTSQLHDSFPNTFINTDSFFIKQSHSLQFTARRFLRLLRDEISSLVVFQRGDA